MVKTITAAQFVTGVWDKMTARYQCPRCGYVCDYGDAVVLSDSGDGLEFICEACKAYVVPVTENMHEIAALFNACGYSVVSAYDEIDKKFYSSTKSDDRLIIRINFGKKYGADVFHELPPQFRFWDNATGDFHSTHKSYCCVAFLHDDFHTLTPYEQELVRDDALQALYDWIKGIHTSEIYKVWRLAEFL